MKTLQVIVGLSLALALFAPTRAHADSYQEHSKCIGKCELRYNECIGGKRWTQELEKMCVEKRRECSQDCPPA